MDCSLLPPGVDDDELAEDLAFVTFLACSIVPSCFAASATLVVDGDVHSVGPRCSAGHLPAAPPHRSCLRLPVTTAAGSWAALTLHASLPAAFDGQEPLLAEVFEVPLENLVEGLTDRALSPWSPA